MDRRLLVRIPLLLFVLLALLTALWAGLLRIGWRLPPLTSTLPAAHGPLMTSAFLGTLIGLERAVALSAANSLRRGSLAGYIGPLLSGMGGLILVLGVGGLWGPTLLTMGSLGVQITIFQIFSRRPSAHTATLGLGALAWVIGNALWVAGLPLSTVAFWWAGFLILTIAGERLELGRLLALSGIAQITFAAAAGLLIAGLALQLALYDTGVRLTGVGMLALAVWLMRHDLARRTVRQPGLTRFIALCLLLGIAWLGIAGALAMISGGVRAGFQYDAMLHAVFLGFVFSMVFGHAPLILPGVLGIQATPYRPSFYVHLALLHVSLALRLGGDFAASQAARQWGGMLNVVAILLFLGNTLLAMRSVARQTTDR